MKTKDHPDDFYRTVLEDLTAAGDLHREDTVLVVCGGATDRRVFLDAGFKNVTISNLDERLIASAGQPFEPYAWKHLKLQHLDLADEAYDFVVVHSGLHHLRCPPLGLTEMFRVARKGILGFEPNKNRYTRLGVRLGFGQEYETAAVLDNQCRWGGVENTEIPNYVYRFCKDDIERTIQAYAPVCRYRYRYWYATRMPGRLFRLRNPLIRRLSKATAGVLELAGRRCSWLANNMAFAVLKPDRTDPALFPWLIRENGRIRFNQRYRERLSSTAEERTC